MGMVVGILKVILLSWLGLGVLSTGAMIGIILYEGAKIDDERETEDNMLQ